mmetsp:Transcript_112903/g.315433  ORF Transcript_112903/g.315433 Transcript_112903/m.315433 type:complete len:246 (+) Transcript_112903:1081-1818(+)
MLPVHARGVQPTRRDELPGTAAARIDHVFLRACGVYPRLPRLPDDKGQDRHVDGAQAGEDFAREWQDREDAVLVVAVPGEVPGLRVPLMGGLQSGGLPRVRDRLRLAHVFRRDVPIARLLRFLGEPHRVQASRVPDDARDVSADAAWGLGHRDVAARLRDDQQHCDRRQRDAHRLRHVPHALLRLGGEAPLVHRVGARAARDQIPHRPRHTRHASGRPPHRRLQCALSPHHGQVSGFGRPAGGAV